MSVPCNFNSVDDEIEYLTKVKTQQHLSHAQARGIIPLFNFYFREKDSNGRTKRLPKVEKDKRWRHYKKKIFTDYNRFVLFSQFGPVLMLFIHTIQINQGYIQQRSCIN